jgi:hypothetical protein
VQALLTMSASHLFLLPLPWVMPALALVLDLLPQGLMLQVDL